jgi:Sulfatase
MALNEYKPGTAFPGVIGRTADESSPAWPQPLRAAPGAPNVLMIVLDDTGFGQLGCYGSPIATPNLDALAAGGLPYSNMHTTALCSPSRSCIIAGRNHHANATAAINEIATRLPRLQREHPVRERVPLRDAAAARLQHVPGRQVPPDAVVVRVRGGPVRQVAAGPRVRAVLRLPRRRHQSVVPGPGLRQSPG